jgi:hypothetical protein
MNTIFKKPSRKNLKMYIINDCAKTPETLWEKQEKATTRNVIIVPMKNPCREKSRNRHYLYVDITSLKPTERKLLKQNSHREKSTM